MTVPTRRPPLAALALCLLLSGTGSLVLEVCWSRQLKLVFGSTTLSISTILVAYMLGLGLGGLLGGRWASRTANGVAAYGKIEIGIGLYALVVPFLLALYPVLNRTLLSGLPFWPAAVVRFLLSLVVLILPTLLMGATLPLLIAAVSRGDVAIGARVGLLYGINTLGAVLGTLAGTFVLFPLLGLRATNWAGALMDLGAGLLALFLIAPRVPGAAPSAAPSAAATSGGRRWTLGLISYGLVGLTALTYEVAWTRVLTMIFGSSIYAFATMLAAFLIGIALGSLLARGRLDGLAHPWAAYAAGLALLGALSLGTMLLLGRMTDLLAAVLAHYGAGGRNLVLGSFALSALAMLGPTLVLGALFPLLVRAAAQGRAASAVTGDVYFVNTLGSATGAFLAGFVLIPTIGLAHTLACAVAINFVTAAAVLLWQSEWTSARRPAAAGAALVAAVLAVLVPSGWDPVRMTRGAYYRPQNALDVGIPLLPFESVPLNAIRYYKDGVSATVSIHDEPGGRVMRINGKPDASLEDMPTQVLSGQIPMLFAPRADDVLVIGFASGVTAGAVSLHEPRRLDVAEIEPAVIAASHYFDEYNHRPLDRPFTRQIVDDGRSYLSATQQQYDVIISEPSNPFLSGCSNLFTKEFFALARRSLRPGGRLLQWIQLYGMDPDGLRSVFAALHTQFPYAYAFEFASDHADLLVLATDRPLRVADVPRWEDLKPAVRGDLEQVGIFSIADLLSLVRLVPADMRGLADASRVVNSDDNMFVELHAPWVMHDSSTANTTLLAPFDTGARGLVGLDSNDAPADLLGRTGLAYAVQRREPAIAQRLIAASRARGGSAAADAAEARLLLTVPDQADLAKQRLADAVAKEPSLLDGQFLLGMIALRGGRPADALPHAEAIIAAAPHDPRGRQLRIEALGALGRFGEAGPDADAMLKSAGARFDRKMWADGAMATAASGDVTRGIAGLERYLAFEPFAVREWDALGALYTQAGRASDAERAKRERGIAAANLTRLSHRNALWEARFGSHERAKKMLQSIVERDPAYDAARKDLAALK